MKILVFMSDNRPLTTSNPQYNTYAAYINFMYCKIHGYKFIYYQPYFKDPLDTSVNVCLDPNTGERRHASWAKLLATQLAMEEDVDYVVYIDSDCIFRNFKKGLEDYTKEEDIVFFSNAPWHPTLPCAGFFLCKVRKSNYEFIRDWYNFKNPNTQSKEWLDVMTFTSKYNKSMWNLGKYWEQDTLWLLCNNQDTKIIVVNEVSLREYDGQYLRHISHDENLLRMPYFKTVVEFLEAQGCPSLDKSLQYIDCRPFDASNSNESTLKFIQPA